MLTRKLSFNLNKWSKIFPTTRLSQSVRQSKNSWGAPLKDGAGEIQSKFRISVKDHTELTVGLNIIGPFVNDGLLNTKLFSVAGADFASRVGLITYLRTPTNYNKNLIEVVMNKKVHLSFPTN